MQRDVYAALIKKRHKPRIPIRILQMDGSITHEPIFDEVFLGYKARRLVLMTHNQGQQDPSRTRAAAHDVVVHDFNALQRMHQPHFRYRLIPLLASSVDAFEALQGICNSRNSVFRIEDRIDPRFLTYRFPIGCSHRDQICDFFQAHIPEAERHQPVAMRRLPIAGVEYQGVMMKVGRVVAPDSQQQQQQQRSSTEVATDHEDYALTQSLGLPSSARNAHPKARLLSYAATLTTHEALTEKQLEHRIILRDVTDSEMYDRLIGSTEDYKRYKMAKNKMHFMGVKRLVGQDAGNASRSAMLAMAKEQQIYIYERGEDGMYRYAV